MRSVITKIRFSQEALNTFHEEVQKFGTVETGGVLLGRVEEHLVIVEKVIDAGPNAIHEDIYFRADSNYIDMMIDMEYANSNGSLSYLGEWHTHPQDIPSPSDVDLLSLEEIADTADDFIILVIIGAIDFTVNRIQSSAISIIKYKLDENFYQLEILKP